MERDFIGYGERPPKGMWPARIAVNFVLNYEEGAEECVLDGDAQSEAFLVDLPGVTAITGRHLNAESLYEYGSRAGVWRILRLFDEYQIPITLFATGLALERNGELALKLKESRHEIAGHGYRWIDYHSVGEAIEREHILKTIGIVRNLGKEMKGWYTGRISPNTRKLVVEAGLKYDSDSYADDLPYWVNVGERKHLIIPYSLDTNDFRYATSPGWCNGGNFLQYLKASFDCLYREGGKMMSIGLHCRLSGRPGRIEALRGFIEYIKSFDEVWICRREEIADLWYLD